MSRVSREAEAIEGIISFGCSLIFILFLLPPILIALDWGIWWIEHAIGWEYVIGAVGTLTALRLVYNWIPRKRTPTHRDDV